MKILVNSIRESARGRWHVQLEVDGSVETMEIGFSNDLEVCFRCKMISAMQHTPEEELVVDLVAEVLGGRNPSFPYEIVGPTEPSAHQTAPGGDERPTEAWLLVIRSTSPRVCQIEARVGDSLGEYVVEFGPGDILRYHRWPEDGLFLRYVGAIEGALADVHAGKRVALPLSLRPLGGLL